MKITRTVAAVVAAVLLAVGCGGQEEERDPYEVYQEIKPVDAEVDLSREEAWLRAKLGCGTEWTPGTVDAALQEAYGERCP